MENRTIEQDFLIENVKISLHSNWDCHHNSKTLYEELKRLGYDVKLVTGYFIRDDDINIKHSWIEFGDKILETDAEQLHIESDFKWKIVDDENTKRRYKKTPTPQNS